jgi:hypothetical protein
MLGFHEINHAYDIKKIMTNNLPHVLNTWNVCFEVNKCGFDSLHCA